MPISIEEMRHALASARYLDVDLREFKTRPTLSSTSSLSCLLMVLFVDHVITTSRFYNCSHRIITLILPSLAPQQPVPVIRVSVTGRLELAQDAFDLVELFRGEVDVDGLDVLDGTFGRA
jgi:hypothetical protein